MNDDVKHHRDSTMGPPQEPGWPTASNPDRFGPGVTGEPVTAVTAAMEAFDEVIGGPLLAAPAPSLEGVSTYLETMRAVERLRMGFRAAVLAKLRGK